MAGPLARRFQGPRTKSHYSPISSDLDQFNERCSRPPSRRIPAAPTPALLAHPTAYAEDFPCTLFLACGGREIRDRTLYDFSRNTNGPSAGVTDRRGSDGPQRLMSSISTRSHHGGGRCASQQNRSADVRFGSKA